MRGELGLDLADRLLRLRLVLLRVDQVDQHLEVVEPRLDAGDAGELGLRVAELARHLLRRLRVVPEVRRGGPLLELGDAGAEGVHADHRDHVAEGGAERRDAGAEVELHGPTA